MPLHVAEQFSFAGALPLQVCERQAQLMDGLREPDLRILIVVQGRFDRRQGRR